MIWTQKRHASIEISVTVWENYKKLSVIIIYKSSVLTHVFSTLSGKFAVRILHEITLAKRLCNAEQDTGLKLLHV